MCSMHTSYKKSFSCSHRLLNASSDGMGDAIDHQEERGERGGRQPLPPQSALYGEFDAQRRGHNHGRDRGHERQLGPPPSSQGGSQSLSHATSRLIVKGLPKYADEKRVKEHFSTHGQVTDVKVMRTREGTSRMFGFVGFSSVEEAVGAQKYYDRTYMDASRMEVGFAQRVGSEEGRRGAWSKYTDGTSRNKEMIGRAKAKAKGRGEDAVEEREKGKVGAEKRKAGEVEDPKLQEFLALMQPRHKKAVWANDDEVGGRKVVGGVGGVDGVGEVGEEDGSDGEYEDVNGRGAAAAEDTGLEMAMAMAMERDVENEEKDAVVADAGVSDLEYMKARMTGNFSEEEEEEAKENGEDDKKSGREDVADEFEVEDVEDADAVAEESPPSAQPSRKPNIDLQDDDDEDPDNPVAIIAKSSRLFLRNLPYSANEDDIRAFLEPITNGELEEVHIITDKATRKSKGYALATFERSEDAIKAFEELDGSIFMGRLLHILPGKIATSKEADDAANNVANNTSSYKKEKDAKLKDEAKSNKTAWNSLFMRADTVADAVADMYSMSKADLLDPSASDMAVRLALGEVKVINMTKEYLEEHGVNIGALEAAAQEAGGKKKDKKGKMKDGGMKRSDAVLIVKNLPFSLDEEELKGIFSDSGPILRWILPPSHTMAIVEFSSNQDASKAFKALAFKRYRSVPIYLEWAPRDIFDVTGRVPRAEKAENEKVENEKAEKAKTMADPLTFITETNDVEDAPSSTIFVKNLAFKTKKAAFEKFFRAAIEACGGELRSAKISQRKKDKKMVSAGFGFVECSSEVVAQDVIKKLQGSALDGHNLVLQIAAAGAGPGRDTKATNRTTAKQADTNRQNTKISVKNLAFEATRQDVLSLFTALGEVKSCRLPRKFDGSHRGFAFVDFASAAEAKTAIASISGTHLYGRRLVLEYAAEAGGED